MVIVDDAQENGSKIKIKKKSKSKWTLICGRSPESSHSNFGDESSQDVAHRLGVNPYKQTSRPPQKKND